MSHHHARFIAGFAAGVLSAAVLYAIIARGAPSPEQQVAPPPEQHVAPPPEQHIAAAPVRNGMTWGVGGRLSDDDGVVFVSCNGRPTIDGHGCEAYVGDTVCSEQRPLLCVAIDGRDRPPGIKTPRAGGVMPDEFYSRWVGGQVALAAAVRGDRFASRTDADAYCAATFGSGWRVAEHHDGGGWGFVANGRIDNASRFWVAINDTSANCWDASR